MNNRLSSVTHRSRWTRLVTGIFLVCLAAGAQAARVKPVEDLKRLPANDDEQGLWVVASGHENNIGNDGRLIRNRDVEAYLEQIANRMLGPRIEHLDIRIDFIIVRNNLLSAWVYPYGTIAVNTGLLSAMENEAQLAAVLAHELSHFLQRHSYRELIAERRQNVIGKGLGLLATAAVAAKTGVVDTNLLRSGGLWSDLVTSGYSRKLEYVADTEGLEMMARAGYPREEAVAAFHKLYENDEYGVVSPRLIWSSHPKLDDRIENLEKEIKKARRSGPIGMAETPPSEDYYRNVAPALLINARLDLEERRFERARRSLTRYLSAVPNGAEAHYLLGESYRREAPDGPDFETRMAAYRRAAGADFSFAEPYKEMGMALRQQGKSGEANAAFATYLRLAPDAADAGIIKGYMQQGR